MGKQVKLGSINAAHYATVYDKECVPIGRCIDTPNSAAYAFSIMPAAVKIVSSWATFTREDKCMQGRIDNANATAEYHSKHVYSFE